METGSQYSVCFYDYYESRSYKSALAILAPLVECLQPASAVDIGCGAHAAWLEAIKRLGVKDLAGLDGAWASKGVESKGFVFWEWNPDATDFPLGQHWDLCLCLEMAEHLTEAGIDRLLDGLCGSSDAVLFSAAAPGQGGTGHINERPQAYWVGLFRARGFCCVDVIRPRFWDDDRVEPWYRQNCFLFLRETRGDLVAKAKKCFESNLDGAPLDVIHPLILLNRVREYDDQLKHYWNPSFRNCLGVFKRWITNVIR